MFCFARRLIESKEIKDHRLDRTGVPSLLPSMMMFNKTLLSKVDHSTDTCSAFLSPAATIPTSTNSTIETAAAGAGGAGDILTAVQGKVNDLVPHPYYYHHHYKDTQGMSMNK